MDLPPFADTQSARPADEASKPGEADAEEITIEDIVATRLSQRFGNDSPLRRQALAFFRYLRGDDGIKPIKGKKPSLAELLNWLYYLGERLPAEAGLDTSGQDFRAGMSILLKHPEDLAPENIDRLIEDWTPEGR